MVSSPAKLIDINVGILRYRQIRGVGRRRDDNAAAGGCRYQGFGWPRRGAGRGARGTVLGSDRVLDASRGVVVSREDAAQHPAPGAGDQGGGSCCGIPDPRTGGGVDGPGGAMISVSIRPAGAPRSRANSSIGSLSFIEHRPNWWQSGAVHPTGRVCGTSDLPLAGDLAIGRSASSAASRCPAIGQAPWRRAPQIAGESAPDRFDAYRPWQSDMFRPRLRRWSRMMLPAVV
jgi:hypothetical protein